MFILVPFHHLQELTEEKFFDETRIFRVLPGFVSQFGINGNPEVQSKWRSKSIPDDPVKVSNERGTVVFATAGANSRTTQIFFNTRTEGNTFLDKQGFSPFGQVLEGMDIVDQLYSGYGEGAPAGKGPNQGLIQAKGNAYLKDSYPKLSYIQQARFAE
jgi:peptidyl-prolyl cis-trans isomerase A (cyclophilin A)